MHNDTPYSYGNVSKILHWLVALFVIGNLIGGLVMEDLPPELRGMIMPVHKSVGIAVLVLMFVRSGWRAFQGFPKLPHAIPARERQLARLGHLAFYPLLILMPLSGWMLSSAADRTTSFFGLFDLPRMIAPDLALREFFGAAHSVLAWGLVALVTVHIAAALYHHYIQGHKLIRRML
ncbi:MAG TPA: cytochrome b [Alphaproteobacteria bacterium]|nr:cytochrome B [Rhodospirillaceae bacterium]HRJ13306.1 cytochrome b [Alphaproteobacteria bacterium]